MAARPGWGAGRYVTGADLPRKIYVRWQSLVEPQTYSATLEIPERARKLMLTKAESTVVPGKKDWRLGLAIGLAPGGWVKVWVMGPVGEPIEVLCTRAEVEAKGPYRGLSGGRHRPLSPRALAYVQAHPIPYDSWRCPAMAVPAE